MIRNDSIIADYDDEKVCYLTGKRGQYGFDLHHVLNGPLRKWADKEGLWVYLDSSVHHWLHDTGEGKIKMKELKAVAQKKWEEKHADEYDDVRAEWLKKVKVNYL